MQIIINQSEIEEAIKQFVLGQMSINDDQEMEIDLRATRGDTGYTAEIIVTNREPEPEPEPLNVAGAIATARKARGPNKPKPEAAAQAQLPVEPAAEPAQEAAEEVQEEAPAAEATDVADAAQEVPADPPVAEEAAPERPTSSIFGGLKKPVNEPTG